MAIREIRIIGDPVLRKKSKKVQKVDSLLLQLINDMAETMYAAPGIGLAAPQVGINKRVVVVDIGGGLLKLINPKVVESSEEIEIDVEGCLSVPGRVGDVERPIEVTIKSMNEEGKYSRFRAEGLLARCLQHEIDHLDGVLYVDKADNLREPEYEGEGEEGSIVKDMDETGEIEENETEEDIKGRAGIPSVELKQQGSAIFEMGK